jgi:hypothetical protein
MLYLKLTFISIQIYHPRGYIYIKNSKKKKKKCVFGCINLSGDDRVSGALADLRSLEDTAAPHWLIERDSLSGNKNL